MDQEGILRGMAQRLVEDMDPEKAKMVLLAVVSGTDLHEAILGGAPITKPKVGRKKGGGRKKKMAPITEPEGGQD